MPHGLKPVQKNRLHEGIISQVQQKIFTGEYCDGEKLPPERILAGQLGVNRATVREALKKLEILGLVEICHGDGIYVRDFHKSANLDLIKDLIHGKNEINVDIMNDLLEVRGILVPEIAAIAATRRNDDDLSRIREIIIDRTVTVQERDVALHGAIARASKNLLYIFMHNFFTEIFMEYGYLYFSSEENRKRSEEFHEKIYKALKEKKSAEARKIMKDVLKFAERRTVLALAATKKHNEV